MAALELRKAAKTCLTFIPDFPAKLKRSVFLAKHFGYIPKFPAKYTNFFGKESENGGTNL